MDNLSHDKTVGCYAKRLLKDESGIVWWIPLLVTFALSTAKGVVQQRQVSKSGKHYAERMMALKHQQELALKEMDIEKMREIRRLNESRTKLYEAGSFQKGSYAGPYFQVVN